MHCKEGWERYHGVLGGFVHCWECIARRKVKSIHGDIAMHFLSIKFKQEGVPSQQNEALETQASEGFTRVFLGPYWEGPGCLVPGGALQSALPQRPFGTARYYILRLRCYFHHSNRSNIHKSSSQTRLSRSSRDNNGNTFVKLSKPSFLRWLCLYCRS